MIRSLPKQQLFKRGFHSTAMSMERIAFIGCGNMGFHMAKNLKENGHDIVACDSNEDTKAKLREWAEVAEEVSVAVKDADVIVTMLPSNDIVSNVYTGENGVLSTAKTGALCIDSSTVAPEVSRKVAEAAEAKGVKFVDAPVSGGVGAAEAGTLTFMVGGSEENVQEANRYLTQMGKNVNHCGDVGTGEVAKLCNNLVLGISMIAVSEAMNLGVKSGIDREVLAGIMNTSTARCWSSDTYNPAPGVMDGVPSSRGYTGGFGSALMLKDLGLATEAADSVGAELPLGPMAKQFYQEVVSSGLGDKDFSVAYKHIGGPDKEA